jgi:hypothetical protein
MTEAEETSRYASRKWQITVVLLIAFLTLFTIQRLTEAGFVELVKWTVGLYFGFNVTQKAVEWVAGALGTKKEPS